MSRIPFLTLVIVLLTAGLACATPTYFGTSGLVSVPTAEVIEKMSTSFSLNHINFDEFNSQTSAIVNYGIMERLEGGITYAMPRGGDNFITLNAKYRLLDGALGMPAVAVGVNNITGAGGRDPQFYGVTTTDIELLESSLSAGLMIESSETRLFGGLAFPVLGFSELIVEQNEDLNLGLRMHLPVVPVDFDITVFDLFDQRSLGLAVSYNRSF